MPNIKIADIGTLIQNVPCDWEAHENTIESIIHRYKKELIQCQWRFVLLIAYQMGINQGIHNQRQKIKK